MSDANKAIIGKATDIYNRGAFDLLDELIRPDYIHHNNDLALTREQFKAGAAWIRKAIPDFRLDIEDMIAEGDRVAIRFVGRGTHLGSMFGETPTSRPIAMYGEVIYRLVDGMIAEDWEATDEGDLRRQVGATEADA
jgi:predicted ester cyclase